MGFHRIDEAPDVRLAHFLGATTHAYLGGSTTTSRWALHPIVVRRPAEGIARHRVYCGTCSQWVEILVRSADLTRRTQRYWLAVLVALLAALSAVEGLLAARAGRHGSGHVLGSLLLGVLVLVVFGGPLVAALDRARHAHGVTLAPRQTRDAVRHHSVPRPPVLGAKYRYRASRAARAAERAGRRTAAAAPPSRRADRVSLSGSRGSGAGTARTGPTAAVPQGGHVAADAVLGLRPGMDRDAVRARLGPSAVAVAGVDARTGHLDVSGSGAVPVGAETWRYDGPFPDYQTSLVFVGGAVERVEIAPVTGTGEPGSASAATRLGRVRIDQHGTLASTPRHTYQAVDALLGPMPHIDDDGWRSERAELRTIWPRAVATIDPVLACVRRLLTDLAADHERPGHGGFLVTSVPDHACVQVRSVFPSAARAGLPDVAYRVWRATGGRWALARSVPRP